MYTIREKPEKLSTVLSGLSTNKSVFIRFKIARINLADNVCQIWKGSEDKLEETLISHLREFLLELGKGFCFEARQKRLTIDGEYYYVDNRSSCPQPKS